MANGRLPFICTYRVPVISLTVFADLIVAKGVSMHALRPHTGLRDHPEDAAHVPLPPFTPCLGQVHI